MHKEYFFIISVFYALCKLTASEIMNILEGKNEDFDVADIVLCPPEVKAEAQSDCDSDHSDEPTALFDHLPGRLLASDS